MQNCWQEHPPLDEKRKKARSLMRGSPKLLTGDLG
jgi:hypothetical protein